MADHPRSDWLETASRRHTCPLCAAGDQYESDYLDALCVRPGGPNEDDETAAAVRDLCAEHTMAFEHASRRAGVHASVVLAVHLSRLEHLATHLEQLDGDSWRTAPACALCVARNEVVVVCAHRLLAGLLEAEGQTVRWLREAGGVCAAHFATCWESSCDGEDREALRRVQLDAVQRLAGAAKASLAGDEFDVARAQAVAARATAITTG